MKNWFTYILLLSAVLFSCKQKHDPKVESADNQIERNGNLSNASSNKAIVYDTTQEAEYIVDSYSNGLFTIEAAKTVKQKTQSNEIKEFAEMIANLQSKKVTDFEQLAKLKRISLPSHLSLIQRHKLKEITEKDSGALEKEFIEEIETKNNEDIVLLEKISKESEDNEIATLAISSLATLKMQLDEIKIVKEKFELKMIY